MTARRPKELPADWGAPGFTPGAAHFAALLLELASRDEKTAEQAERALSRAGRDGAAVALSSFSGAEGPLRARLVRVVGRVAKDSGSDELRAALSAFLSDREAKVRRNAAIALGKCGGPGVEEALLTSWPESELPMRRSLAEALGKVGGARSRELLTALETTDPELERLRRRALTMLSRTAEHEPCTIALEQRLPATTQVVLGCRRGSSDLLCEEMRARGLPEPRRVSPVELWLEWSGPLAPLLSLRIAQSIALQAPLGPGESRVLRIIASLKGEAGSWLRALTHGTPRFRLSWDAGGHRRLETWKVAEGLAGSGLVNAPSQAPWEVRVEETRLLLIPRGAPDSRFDYRVSLVPAASHPNLAAALARLAGAVADYVVWDPFVGSGLELVERARLGGYRSLHGSDVDPSALDAAEKNLRSAGVRATLARADARHHAPRGVTLILTNPPMGRRVARDGSLAPLLDAFVENAARVLVPAGRLVWLSPLPERTARLIRELGLALERRASIDMGGFDAEPQVARRQRL